MMVSHNNSDSNNIDFDEISALLQASRAFQAGLNLQETLDIIVQSVRNALAFNRAIISLVETEGGIKVLRRYSKIGLTDPEFRKLRPTTSLHVLLEILKDEFRVSQSYFVPHTKKDLWEGHIDVNTMDRSLSWREGNWHPEDLLLVPIIDEKNQMIGLLSVDDPSSGQVPTERIHKLLEIFANKAAFAISTASQYQIISEILKKREHDLFLTRQVANQLSQADRAVVNPTLTVNNVLDSIITTAQSLTRANYVDVIKFDQAREKLFIRRSSVENLNDVKREVDRGGIVGWVANNGQAKIVEDTTSEPLYLDLKIPEKLTRSEMAVPIIIGGVVEGVLNFESNEYGMFGGHQLDIAQSLVMRTAMMLRFEAHRKELEAFREIDRAILDSTKDLRNTLNVVLDKSLKLVRAKHGNILLLERGKEGEKLIIQATTGDTQTIGMELPIDNSISGLPIVEGRSVRVSDVESHPLYQRVLNEEYMRSEMVVCLLDNEVCLGVINVESPNTDAFSERDEKLLESIASQASIAIRIAKSQDELTLISEIDTGILNSKNLNELMGFILKESLRITGAIHGNILEVRGEDLIIAATTGDQSRLGTRLEIKNSISGWPIVHNESILIHDLSIEPWRELYKWVLLEDRMRSELAVPLLNNGLPIGVLNIESPKQNAFNEHHKKVLEAVANQAAVAMMMEKTRELLTQQESINNVALEISVVMHEIGSKVFPIRDSSERLEVVKGLSKDSLDDLKIIKQASIQIRELVQQMLSPSRELEKGPLEPGDAIAEALQLSHISLDEILLEKAYENVPLVRADRRALIDILVNLINNAVDAMENSERKVLGIFTYDEVNLRMVRFDVSDTGCGIESERWNDIWKPFVSTKRLSGETSGSGLGLYACKKLVVRLGGEIFIDKSEVDVGSVFSFRLPYFA